MRLYFILYSSCCLFSFIWFNRIFTYLFICASVSADSNQTRGGRATFVIQNSYSRVCWRWNITFVVFSLYFCMLLVFSYLLCTLPRWEYVDFRCISYVHHICSLFYRHLRDQKRAIWNILALAVNSKKSFCFIYFHSVKRPVADLQEINFGFMYVHGFKMHPICLNLCLLISYLNHI